MLDDVQKGFLFRLQNRIHDLEDAVDYGKDLVERMKAIMKEWEAIENQSGHQKGWLDIDHPQAELTFGVRSTCVA